MLHLRFESDSFLRKWNKLREIFLVSLLFCLFLPLFFYNLGGFSLADFDEAWYAEVVRNILRNGNPLILTFNGNAFTEHPPMGFNIIALSFLIFGINNFAARFPSAIFGFLSLFVLYAIGKKLFNKTVGLSSSLILISCVWFMFRARSGNLDTIFLFFYLLTFYLGLKVKDNIKWLYLMTVSFSILFLIKYMIGLTVLILIISYYFIDKIHLPVKSAVKAVLLLIILLSLWFITNYSVYGLHYFQNMINMGLRTGFRIKPDLWHFLSSNTFVYLHNGIGKWYYPGLVSILFSLFFIRKKKVLVVLYVWFFILLSGFMTNSKTEIWHLIPIYPVLALFLSNFIYQLSWKFRLQITPLLTLSLIFIVCLYQIYQYRHNIKLIDKEISDLAFVSMKASGRPEKLYLDGHDFMPSSVFYSEKKVFFLRRNKPPKDSLKGLVNSEEKNVLILTENWKLEADKIDPKLYEVIAKQSGRMLILTI